MNELVDKYKPIFYLDRNEKYFPASISFFYDLPLFNKDQKLYDKTNEEIISSITPNFTKDIFIDIPKDKLIGNPNLNEVEIYAIIKETENTIDIYYIILYPFNYGKTVLNLKHTGDHQGDVEMIIVELDKQTQEINRVFYGSHALEDGRWVKKEDVEFQGTHPIVYVAFGGHGNYPKSGAAFRFFGLGNDLLRKGKKWEPNVVILENDHPWLKFRGLIGRDGVSNIPDKSWMYTKPTDDILKPPVPILSETKYYYYKIAITLVYILFFYLLFLIGLKRKNKKLYFSILILSVIIVSLLIRYIVEKYA